eukprot:gb/GFBE01002335.1/.p1 GENE.gb/GFBE01002335.1/~~gb/GFBE01002335.1/.p1  ORF type:complete len:259 (+),score=32.53 gb/GFBE01002335.1/:1-777(+)
MKALRIGLAFLAVLMSWTLVFYYIILYDDGDLSKATPVSIDAIVPGHCREREAARQLLQEGKVTVAFPLLGKQNAVYWQKSKDHPLPKPDSSLFPVEKVYRAGWVHLGVKPKTSLDATFVVSKQALTPPKLCTNYPRHQVFNHVDSFRSVTVKSSLARTVRSFARRHPSRSKEIERLVPPSYWLSLKEDCDDFRSRVDSAMWIRKQDFMHNSMGVQLLSAQEASSLASTCATKAPSVLVQMYLFQVISATSGFISTCQ